jgi:hypothetical protein
MRHKPRLLENRGIVPMPLKYGSDQKAGGGGLAAREGGATPDIRPMSQMGPI